MDTKDTSSVWFSVPFVKAQARPRFSSHGGYPRAYKTKADRSAERAVIEAFKQATKQIATTFPILKPEPVSVSIYCLTPLPKNTPKKINSQMFTVKPDADNVAKLILDALNGLAYADDSQIVSLRVEKLPRVHGVSASCGILIKWSDAATQEIPPQFYTDPVLNEPPF